MDWSNERYVRLYTRDTTTWKLFSWQARCTLALAIRKADRAGVIEVGDTGVEGLAAMLELPFELVEVGIADLMKRGTVVHTDTAFVLPNFIEAQETRQSDPARARESRERRRADTLRKKQAGGAVENRISAITGKPGANGSIYVVRSPSRDLIKIGFTANAVSDRVRALEGAAGEDLELLAFFDGTVEDERALHEQFAEHRAKGEWFRNVDAVTQWLGRVTTRHQESPAVTPSDPSQSGPILPPTPSQASGQQNAEISPGSIETSADKIKSRTSLVEWARTELSAIRARVAAKFGWSDVRPVHPMDACLRDLRERLSEAGDAGEEQLRHVLRIAELDAIARRSSEYLGGGIFTDRAWSKKLGMREADVMRGIGSKQFEPQRIRVKRPDDDDMPPLPPDPNGAKS